MRVNILFYEQQNRIELNRFTSVSMNLLYMVHSVRFSQFSHSVLECSDLWRDQLKRRLPNISVLVLILLCFSAQALWWITSQPGRRSTSTTGDKTCAMNSDLLIIANQLNGAMREELSGPETETLTRYNSPKYLIEWRGNDYHFWPSARTF